MKTGLVDLDNLFGSGLPKRTTTEKQNPFMMNQ